MRPVIGTYDAVPGDGEIGSADFDLPEAGASLCIGFRHLGGPLHRPQSWQYDHANIWAPDETLRDSSPRAVERAMRAAGLTSLEHALRLYTRLLASSDAVAGLTLR